MTARLACQLAAHRELKGERCPGETICSERGILFKYRGRPVEDVCGGCNLRHTKPEPSPLLHAQNTAVSLEEMQRCGAVFLYTPTAYEWACLKALQRARAQDNAVETKQREAADKKREAAANKQRK